MNATQYSESNRNILMAYLDHFGHSVGELEGEEGLEESGIDKDVFRPARMCQSSFCQGVLIAVLLPTLESTMTSRMVGT